MSGITDLDVTFGSAFKVGTFTRKQGRSLNGTAVTSKTVSWLWLDKHTASDEIVEIRILRGDEACPTGWEKVRREVTHIIGEGGGVFIAFRRKSSGEIAQPIVDVAVLHDKDSVPGETIAIMDIRFDFVTY